MESAVEAACPPSCWSMSFIARTSPTRHLACHGDGFCRSSKKVTRRSPERTHLNERLGAVLQRDEWSLGRLDARTVLVVCLFRGDKIAV